MSISERLKRILNPQNSEKPSISPQPSVSTEAPLQAEIPQRQTINMGEKVRIRFKERGSELLHEVYEKTQLPPPPTEDGVTIMPLSTFVLLFKDKLHWGIDILFSPQLELLDGTTLNLYQKLILKLRQPGKVQYAINSAHSDLPPMSDENEVELSLVECMKQFGDLFNRPETYPFKLEITLKK